MFGLSINEPSPIIKAIQAGQSLDAIKALLTAGADVNRSDRYGKLPLMEALHTGPISLVRLLLEHGADPNDTAVVVIVCLILSRGTSAVIVAANGAHTSSWTGMGLNWLIWFQLMAPT